MPEVRQTFEPYFRRALQRLCTETPINACRQIGPILHFVEDAGALPHTRVQIAHHHELESWVRDDRIVIPGYRPRLLGRTDDDPFAGLLRRLDGLNKFSKARLLCVSRGRRSLSPICAKVEPIILESALEYGRVSADLLHTLFTLGLAPQPEGASLSGDVTAGTAPFLQHQIARIVLVNTDYATLATMDKAESKDGWWHGRYAFHNLPPGSYRVLAYRTGSQSRISEPIVCQSPCRRGSPSPCRKRIRRATSSRIPDGRLSYGEPGYSRSLAQIWRSWMGHGGDLR